MRIFVFLPRKHLYVYATQMQVCTVCIPVLLGCYRNFVKTKMLTGFHSINNRQIKDCFQQQCRLYFRESSFQAGFSDWLGFGLVGCDVLLQHPLGG